MNLLQEAEQKFVSEHRHVQTPLGMVVKMSFSQPVPPGWRRLTIDEGRESKGSLDELLDEWSIVAFETGALDGFGYGNKFRENYGEECGEGFVIKM